MQRSCLYFSVSPARTWYVDSTRGDTLAAVRAQPGDTIYLACGSRFREELTDLPVGVRVRTYGAGARPVIDGRDVASNAAFTKTGGRTNVYQIAWAHAFDSDGGKSKHRVWEDDAMLTRAASLAACDSTPGSFYAADPTASGPDTVYVHPTGSTTPTREYAITRRRWAVQLYEQYNQAHVVGIEAIGNSHADGALCIDGYAEDCVARDGRVHNAFVLGEAYNCQALGIEPGVASSTMFVSYIATGQFGGPFVRDVKYRACVADAGRVADSLSGFFIHTNGDGRNFGTVQYEECETIGCSEGWGGTQAARFVAYKCNHTDAVVAYFQKMTEVVILGGSGRLRNVTNATLLSHITSAFSDVTMHGAKVRNVAGGEGPFIIRAPNAHVTIDRCTVLTDNGGIVKWERGFVSLHRTVIAYGNLLAGLIGQAATQVEGFTADRNCYWTPYLNNSSFGKALGGTTYFITLADWRTHLTSVALGVDREANSITVDPLVDEDTFEIGSSVVRALGAGAEPDEEDDPELQALWAQYRI